MAGVPDGITAADIANMKMTQYVEFRAKYGEQLGLSAHGPAWIYSLAPYRVIDHPASGFPGPYSRGALNAAFSDTSHPYHPENPFNLWRAERQKFIDGDDDALERLRALVRVEDGNKYDEVAAQDLQARRAKAHHAPEPAIPGAGRMHRAAESLIAQAAIYPLLALAFGILLMIVIAFLSMLRWP